MVERESTLTMIPPSNLNARVVVPLANLTVWPASLLPQAEAKLFRQKCAGWACVRDDGGTMHPYRTKDKRKTNTKNQHHHLYRKKWTYASSEKTGGAAPHQRDPGVQFGQSRRIFVFIPIDRGSGGAGIEEMHVVFHSSGTYIGHVGNVELTGLAEGETGDHGTASDGPLIVPEFEFVCPDVENIIADYERGTKHDDIIYDWMGVK
jgi:hypothetical protein